MANIVSIDEVTTKTKNSLKVNEATMFRKFKEKEKKAVM